MLQFKSQSDLQQLSPESPAHPIVAELVQRLIVDYQAEGWPHDPDADGWVVLIEPHGVDRPLTEIWEGDTRLADLWWEGFSERDHHFIGIYLANNQFGLCFVIPDADWLGGELRRVIEENLDPPPRKTRDLI